MDLSLDGLSNLEIIGCVLKGGRIGSQSVPTTVQLQVNVPELNVQEERAGVEDRRLLSQLLRCSPIGLIHEDLREILDKGLTREWGRKRRPSEKPLDFNIVQPEPRCAALQGPSMDASPESVHR